MNPEPFLLRLSKVPSDENESPNRDALSDCDPLPAVVEISVDGYALARDTTNTAAKTETTDDR
jgi:hypothetical protein